MVVTASRCVTKVLTAAKSMSVRHNFRYCFSLSKQISEKNGSNESNATMTPRASFHHHLNLRLRLLVSHEFSLISK